MTEYSTPAIDRSIYPMPMFVNLVVRDLAAAAGSTTVSFAAGEVDLSTVATGLHDAGATAQGPLDLPWFTTDVRFADPDGNTIVLTAQRTDDRAQARAWAQDGIQGDFVRPETVEP